MSSSQNMPVRTYAIQVITDYWNETMEIPKPCNFNHTEKQDLRKKNLRECYIFDLNRHMFHVVLHQDVFSVLSVWRVFTNFTPLTLSVTLSDSDVTDFIQWNIGHLVKLNC